MHSTLPFTPRANKLACNFITYLRYFIDDILPIVHHLALLLIEEFSFLVFLSRLLALGFWGDDPELMRSLIRVIRGPIGWGGPCGFSWTWRYTSSHQSFEKCFLPDV